MTVPRLGDPGGFALGEQTVDSLETVGITQSAWVWQYNSGEVRPGGSYPPHRDLDGEELVELPTPDGYYPGDHNGCRCSAVPVLQHVEDDDIAPAVEVPPLTEEQYEALNPTLDRYNKARDKAAVKVLTSTEEGAALHDTLSKWQYSHSSNVTRIRNNVAARLKGELKDGTKSAADADRLISAINNSPLKPPELYRGMKIPGTTEEVLAMFRGQETMDINVSSFTSRQNVAANFMYETEGQAVKAGKNHTGVFMIVEEGPNVKGLPIENMSGGAGIWQEREWISGGRYDVLQVGANKDGQIIIRLRQVAGLGD